MLRKMVDVGLIASITAGYKDLYDTIDSVT